MIKKIRILLKIKANRAILENFFSLSAVQVFSMFLPLITLPYVLRVIGLSNFGTIAIATSLIGYFTSITDFSFTITATRDVSIFRHSKKKLNLIYSKVMTIKSIFLGISLAIIALITYLYPPFYEERLIFFICASALIGNVLFPEWFFQGIEKMKYISFIKIGLQILFSLSIFVFIKERTDYWVYPLLISGGAIISGIIGQIILIYRYRLKFIWLPIKKIKQTLIENTPIFINQFLPTLYNNTSTFLLGFFAASYVVGVYAAIRKIIDLAVVLLKILSRVFFPFINKKRDAFKYYQLLISYLTMGGIGLILLSHQVIFWYLNINYDNAFIILFLLSLSIVGVALYDIYGLNYLIVRRKDKLVMKNTFTTSLIGFFLGFPLIFFYGIMGAALNLLISRLILGLGIYYQYSKFVKDEKNSLIPISDTISGKEKLNLSK